MGARTRGLANNVLTSGKLDATDAISGVIPASNIANGSLTSATTYGSVTGGVPAVSSDPPSPSEGDIWYNTTTGKLRFRAQAGAWASGGNLNTGRSQSGAAGTQTSSLVASGNQGGSPLVVNNVETYNGTAFTEVGDVNTGRRIGASAAADSTAGLFFGGWILSGNAHSALNESWNGSSWTEVGDINTSRGFIAGAGTATAALAFGGGPPGGNYGNETEVWNGSSWTEVNNLNTNRYAAGQGGGTTTAAIAAGGSVSGGQTADCETWNGSSWTEVNNLNTARSHQLTTGTTTNALVAGGEHTTQVATSETWNGTSWSNIDDMATARHYLMGAGTGTAGIAIGGDPGRNISEEWTFGTSSFDVG